MARLKLVLAMMMHETNTFSPVPTPLSSFRPLQGEAAIAEFKDTNTQLGGFLHVAQQAGAEIVLPVAGGAHPSGYVEKAAYEDMVEVIVGAVRGGCDAVFLALHGAMVAEHVDVGDTGQRAGRTMMRALRGEIEPVMVWGSLPMMTSTLVHTPSRQPMKDVMDMAMAAEASGAVLSASVFGGFPHSDIPHLSMSAVIVCDRRTDAGRVLRDRLLAMAWDRRADYLYNGAPLAGQVAH